MTYRDDSAEEINRLTNELAQAREDLRLSHRSTTHWRHTAASAMIGALVVLGVLVLGLFVLSVRAPLSANTRGAAHEFCDALDKQEREEREEGP